jgi:hypothetical protein
MNGGITVYLHLGCNEVVHLDEVVAIFDLSILETGKAAQDFLAVAQMEGKVTDLSQGRAKAFVVTRDAVYLSPITSSTLYRRGRFFSRRSLSLRD